MSSNKVIHIIGGGTVSHVRNHLALCAPAYGETSRTLASLCRQHPDNQLDVSLHLTRMAAGVSSLPNVPIDTEITPWDTLPQNCTRHIETNADVDELIGYIVGDERAKIIFFNPALCDYEGSILEFNWGPGEQFVNSPSGKYAKRLHTSDGSQTMELTPAPKILNRIRKTRKDITLVAFKTTCGATEDEQYLAGLNLLKANSCNLVLANDTLTRVNMIITPEEARYHVTRDRNDALRNLVDMAIKRSHLTFTRSTVVSGEAVAWGSPEVPAALRTVVNACIEAGAYKPFRGATVGHFAAKIGDNVFLTSKRKTNFNDLASNGLVRVVTDGPDSVIAYGAKPSVGGQSQRIIFADHPEYDCICHFHCPMRTDAADDIPHRSQRDIECGSHQCGAQTSGGLKTFDLGDGDILSAVMLDEHGPNIVFHHSINPKKVIDFIHRNWDLSQKTGGYVA